MTWATLFDRGDGATETPAVDAIRDALGARRSDAGPGPRGRDTDAEREGPGSENRDPSDAGAQEGTEPAGGDPPSDADRPDPARVVAGADVLAADLLVGGAARDALDHVRRHDWVDLVASDVLLADAEAVIADFAGADLAAAWRDRVASERVAVAQPQGDHPGLASAAAGGAAHLLTFDDGLSTARANLSLQPHVRVSVRQPDAFARLFDPASLYAATVGGDYPGPDRDPRY
jgi:hypothetical protein